MTIRPETPADHGAVRHVNLQAFEQPGEADLVDRLRQEAHPYVSLVAVVEEEIVGHVFFSPVQVTDTDAPTSMMGLAPMAVLPERQRQGVGTKLAQEGLDACRRQGVDAVVVLGHPNYYPRFGFRPAAQFGLKCEFDVPDEAFMALELTENVLNEVGGTVSYHPAFGVVT